MCPNIQSKGLVESKEPGMSGVLSPSLCARVRKLCSMFSWEAL